ncbi:hypothetical protein NQ317_014418 [Molorchus minor]|uniref:Uncharacterized protein n=1 Tax=Molorchus minor TaxID=1323400 RepID=A0ABQ9K575_9CUCU|nr:hypothetical protein NQ317_014418 [Molorchus minor]
MEVEATESPVSDLRNDFEIYKTQVAICAWIGAAIVFILLCAVIYSFIAIRKLRLNLEEKIQAFQESTRFTIDRPKLIIPSQPSPARHSPYNSPMVPSTPASFVYNSQEKPKPKPLILVNDASRSPAPIYISPISPTGNKNRNSYTRNNDGFLNANRNLYSPGGRREGDVTPQSPSPPLYASPSPSKNGKFF